MMAVFAQMERDITIQRIKSGMDNARDFRTGNGITLFYRFKKLPQLFPVFMGTRFIFPKDIMFLDSDSNQFPFDKADSRDFYCGLQK